jgi:RNA polymerase sigma factor FliA
MSSARSYAEERDRDSMVHECLPQVKRLASRLAARLPAHVDVRDLVQSGLIGLLDAIEKYDPERGIQFWTYAETRVRGAMLDSLRRLDPVPRSVRRRRREIESAYSRLESRLGRAATDDEVADELSMEVTEFEKILEEVRSVEIGLSFADGNEDAIQFVADEKAIDPLVVLQRDEMREHLVKSLEALPERDQLLISLYYQDELTMKEIGKVLHVNESRVSQLHSRAILRLRAQLTTRLTRTAELESLQRQTEKTPNRDDGSRGDGDRAS